jgi:uncharacterized protein YbaR (Trm112 family)
MRQDTIILLAVSIETSCAVNKKPIEKEIRFMVSAELLEILRCPVCVSGPTRRPGDDPGKLELVKDTWLVCTEQGCGHKYPIRDDIPVMLIDEGAKWVDVDVDDLPVPPPQE